MNITYERDIDHCHKSEYVKKVTIKSVEPAKNSDFLDNIEFNEMGWCAIAKRDEHKVGEKVMFIPAESVLPLELSEELDVTKYLSKGRVRVTRLRGNRSEGLIVPENKVEPYLPYIMKWEDKPTVRMMGETKSPAEVSIDFEKFYHMPNILNEPYTFEPGEKIVYSEKIHGTNTRMGILPNPVTEEAELYVGSHNIVLKESEKNIYWRKARHVQNLLQPGYVFYGEIYGLGIQHFHYDQKIPAIRFFSASTRGTYLLPEEFMILCDKCLLPRVDFHETEFKDIEQLRELAEQPSELTKSHGREGIVIVSAERPGRMAKCISFKYLDKKNRTERK